MLRSGAPNPLLLCHLRRSRPTAYRIRPPVIRRSRPPANRYRSRPTRRRHRIRILSRQIRSCPLTGRRPGKSASGSSARRTPMPERPGPHLAGRPALSVIVRIRAVTASLYARAPLCQSADVLAGASGTRPRKGRCVLGRGARPGTGNRSWPVALVQKPGGVIVAFHMVPTQRRDRHPYRADTGNPQHQEPREEFYNRLMIYVRLTTISFLPNKQGGPVRYGRYSDTAGIRCPASRDRLGHTGHSIHHTV